MALYVDEEEVWKCPKHPSKRRRTGICHVCLREKLSSLCPDCAHVRPCSCYYAAASIATTTTSSGSASSSFSRFSSVVAAGIGSVGRVSTLIESEPSFRRSRSLAVPFLRSKPAVNQDYTLRRDSATTTTTTSFWSLFKGTDANRSRRSEVEPNSVVSEDDAMRKNDAKDERRRMLRKSRSVAVTSDSGVADVRSSKGRSWYFPSPIKVFRQSISRGMVHERSPLYRG